ncbi:chemotaxis protein CheD [Halorussus pelagicus]|uniref:chemotaxis protein CheD n=1 Tax=Halorussus pelagicus TaxID=2505977 RepID=UPI000FFC5E0E|nr:chemotaxis protein CheD [Halorussus pelagicus]
MTAERTPFTDESPERTRVGVAEFAVASGDTRLTTSGLGSCVGIALADPTAAVAGLAHVMLPDAPDDDRGKPAKSVEQGIKVLLTELEDEGADLERVEAKLAGGSQMFDFSGISEAVGERNVERIHATLADRDISVVAEDVGGDYGRSVELTPETWTLKVSSTHQGVKNL